jgi:hypothetical protein
MPSNVSELIGKWCAVREKLLQIAELYPEEHQLRHPLYTYGIWPPETKRPESDLELAQWRKSILELMDESKDFFNYHSDIARFEKSWLYAGCSTHRHELSYAHCLRGIAEMLDLLGWHDKPLGVLVYERMKAKGHKLEALALALETSPSTLSRSKAEASATERRACPRLFGRST